MSNTQIVLIIAGVIYYLYSSVKGKDAQKNKKTTSNPTPTQKSTLDDILDKMLEKQKRKIKELKAPDPKDFKGANKKIVFKDKTLVIKDNKQGLPFENRKLTEPREMPSRKQIERVTLREKRATEPVVIKVKDYDLDLVNHDLPHKQHPLPNDSNIQFHFKADEKDVYIFDTRQAIIAQIILERKF